MSVCDYVGESLGVCVLWLGVLVLFSGVGVLTVCVCFIERWASLPVPLSL